LNASPAKAGVHRSAAGAADGWVPASAGTAVVDFIARGSTQPVGDYQNNASLAGLDPRTELSGGKSAEATQECFGNCVTPLPQRKLGSSVPQNGPVEASEAFILPGKLRAAERWVPAFAGTAKEEFVVLSPRSAFLPSLTAHSAIGELGRAHRSWCALNLSGTVACDRRASATPCGNHVGAERVNSGMSLRFSALPLLSPEVLVGHGQG
jgi:hypothetical protein